MQEIGAHVPSKGKIGAIVVSSLDGQSLDDGRIFEFLDFSRGERRRNNGMLRQSLTLKKEGWGEYLKPRVPFGSSAFNSFLN